MPLFFLLLRLGTYFLLGFGSGFVTSVSTVAENEARLKQQQKEMEGKFDDSADPVGGEIDVDK